jgi:hypothetical protein
VSGLCVVRASVRTKGLAVLPGLKRALESLNERGLSVPLMLSASYFRRSVTTPSTQHETHTRWAGITAPLQSARKLFYPMLSTLSG